MAALPLFARLEPLETVGIFTPLGIRFWDTALNRPVEDGLDVIARPLDRPRPIRRAYRTTSGIYAFDQLPGLRSLEILDPSLPAGAHPQPGTIPTVRFVVEVHDLHDRFFDAAFPVDLPYKGIFPTNPPAGGGAPVFPGVFLFSRPNRPVPTDAAAVRAQMVERVGAGRTRPARHAVLEIQVNGGARFVGLAGEDGGVVVIFSYPKFDAAAAPGSPVPGPIETRLQGWDLTARVRYQPAAQTPPDKATRTPNPGMLLSQPFARLRTAEATPGQDQMAARLTFSRPLALETAARKDLLVELP